MGPIVFVELGWTLEDERDAHVHRAGSAAAAFARRRVATTPERILELQEEGASKMVPSVFTYALGRIAPLDIAAAVAGDARIVWIVGDRIDDDIVPARAWAGTRSGYAGGITVSKNRLTPEKYPKCASIRYRKSRQLSPHVRTRNVLRGDAHRRGGGTSSRYQPIRRTLGISSKEVSRLRIGSSY